MGDSNLKLILISSTLDCTTFHSFNVKKEKDFQKLAGLWLAGEMVDHIGIYGSKVAEGLSAIQRRSCFSCGPNCLVPKGNKLLSKLMWTIFKYAKWCHLTTMS